MRNFLRWLIIHVLDLIAEVSAEGLDNFPSQGAYIAATNHIGFLDITLFHYHFNRYDMFIPVAEKWEKSRLIRMIARNLNFVFIDRYNPDLKALRKMMSLMEAGNSLVIAPEGTRSKTGSLAQGKQGVAYLAARSGFPVIPVGITGTEDKNILTNLRRFKRSKIVLKIGQPFNVEPLPHGDKDAALQERTDEIMCRIAAILPEKYRGVYAEHPKTLEFLK
ncbi:MAG TPA: lysophospholipid acyltransferase family protein [Anaerolineales bacterium]|nr:lysophospholipid acyltransferase family protein [Anaerolineales bacterium]